MNYSEEKKYTDKYVLGTYTRYPYSFIKGKGSWLWTHEGKKVLDFFPGWGVSNLGHCHPLVTKALTQQAKTILHLANVFYIPGQGTLAKELVKKSFPGEVFFGNSGAESVECAFKAIRLWGNRNGKKEIITFKKSFHGRTSGAVTLTGQSHYHKPFAPLVSHVKYGQYNDLKSLEKLISDKTAAVMLEPVQGEGGVHVASKEFIQGIEKLRKKYGFLLVFDEVQTGFGRTGKFFAFKHFSITPDILCLSKSIAGGFPMGATVLGKKVAPLFQPGMHASTFGGNYMACQAALAVIQTFEKEKILQSMKPVQKLLQKTFKAWSKEYSEIKEFRHLGMMFGIEFEKDYAKAIAEQCLQEGLIINCTAKNVLRIMPALTLSLKDCKKGIAILEKVLSHVCNK